MSIVINYITFTRYIMEKEIQKTHAEATGPLMVAPAFMLLFPTRLSRPFSGFGHLPAEAVEMSAEQKKAYLAQFSDFEGRLLGESFLETHRMTRWPLGRIMLPNGATGVPPHADVSLLVHASGVALWEAWLPAPEQAFEADRWIAWLDPEEKDSLPARLWQVIAPVNREFSGSERWSETYFPVTLLSAPRYPLDVVTGSYSPDLVRLSFLDHAPWPLRDEVVRQELDNNYCMRAGGMTLLSRRSAVDVHAREMLAGEASPWDLPPRSALSLVITLEILLIERTALQQLYERLSHNKPKKVEDLLSLKQEVFDELEEYYGAITTATRFSDAITADGERLLGITVLYEAVIDRLDAVSFEITTRYQKQMTDLQFWLTVVFGAVEIGFIASGIATWYYSSELALVLAWTTGATLSAALLLVAILRRKKI